MTLQEYLKSLAGKRAAVVGAGLSNRPLVAMLADADVDTTVYDKTDAAGLGTFYEDMSARGVKFHLGEGYMDGLDGDIIFRSPSVLPFRPELVRAAERGAVITSEMEVFMSLCPCPIIAVTGSDGKTTTTTLIAKILEETDNIAPGDAAVLELSSFQLHSMMCAADVAVITNMAPNHLDIHKDYQDYIDAKKQIFKNQRPDGKLVLNQDNAVTAACAGEARGSVWWFSRKDTVSPGVYLRPDGMICACVDGETTEMMPAADIRIPGMHNVENMMTAFAATWGLADLESMRSVARTFTGVAHRLETVRVHKGVTYINDSIASSPDRTLAGLACFDEKLILIAGGKDKGVPFTSLGPAICRHVKKLYLTGLTAVKAAAAAAQPGDTVLMSPASTSFDRFKNFEERGDLFRRIIGEME